MKPWIIPPIAAVVAGLALWIFSLHRECGQLRQALAEARANAAVPAPPPAPPPPAPGQTIPEEPMPRLAPDLPPEDLQVTRTEVPVPPSEPENADPGEAARTRALAGFDRAMDREFNRLERREATAASDTETQRIGEIREKLLALDALWIEADGAPGPERARELQSEIRRTMGDIIRLAEQDRRESLAEFARSLGYTDEAQVNAFVQEIRRVVTGTDMDWASLFNRAPSGAAPSGERSVSPGMTAPER